MKFSLSWLKDHLDTTANIDQIAEAMTMAGLEVEEVEDKAKLLAPFSVAKIISAARHPNADRLQVCQVETKDGLKEIVCGAPNARAGLVTIYAPIGAYVPGLDVTLVEKPVRGVVSNGMLCSASELCLADESDGILELPGDLTVGTLAAEVFGVEPVIDFEVTPNRPDWLGVYGIARDLAATGLGRLKVSEPAPIKGSFPSPIKVAIEAEDACAMFAGRVIRGVKNGPSPKWLQDKLTSIGLKPISALVDVTNYLSYDRARPLHVYDVAKISGDTLTARLGRDGEKLEALDGKTYDLSAEMCVIADSVVALGLGGVMGGTSSGCSDETVDVFVESAYFDPIRTAQTGRTTTITSDAQYRFARGVDPEFVVPGLELATQIILDICGGEASEIVVAGQPLEPRAPIAFDPAYVHQLTGLSIGREGVFEILKHLGFSIEGTGTSVTVHVPSWRRDVEGKADLVEEVARIAGFGELPSTPLPVVDPKSGGVISPRQARARTARRALAAYGYNEVVSWSFTSEAKAALFAETVPALRLANPIAAELDYMRPSALPNLVEMAARNAARGHADVALFEVGPIYLNDGPKDQRTTITALIAPHAPRHWDAKGQDPLFQLKSDLFALLEDMGAPTASLQIVQGQNKGHWHPGRSARLQLGPKQILAEFGELHPQVLKALGASGPMLAFELVLENTPEPKKKSGKSRGKADLPSLQPVTRDFAFLMDAQKPAGDLARVVAAADKALITGARVFDVYQGKGVPEGQVSLALEVTLQPRDKTLTDEDITAVTDKVLAAASKQGAVLRA